MPARTSGSSGSRGEAAWSALGRSSGGVATVGASSGSNSSASAPVPKIERNTASKAGTCAGSDTNTARAVQ